MEKFKEDEDNDRNNNNNNEPYIEIKYNGHFFGIDKWYNSDRAPKLKIIRDK